MSPRLWALSFAPIFAASGLAASTAYAQPGAYAEPPPSQPYYGPSAPTSAAPTYYGPSSYTPHYAQPPGPAPANPCTTAAVPVMARRWSIGLSIGQLGLSPEEAPEGTEAEFRIAELAIRYRASRRLELELAMSGGREVLADNLEGDLATGSVTLALRYRFRPEQRWSWWVMGGLGGTVVAPYQSTEAEREGATRPLGMVGIGVERRFRRFALQAELRGMGVGPREDAMGGDDVPVTGGGGTGGGGTGGTPPPTGRLPASFATTHAEELGGGMFTLGASYYF